MCTEKKFTNLSVNVRLFLEELYSFTEVFPGYKRGVTFLLHLSAIMHMIF